MSNVVNSTESVSEETRERVEAAIAKLGWVPNESARQLRAGRSRSIGMVVTDITQTSFADVLLGVEDRLRGHGYSVHVANSGSQPGRAANQLRLFEQRVRGVLLCTSIAGVSDRVDDLRRRGMLHCSGSSRAWAAVSVRPG